VQGDALSKIRVLIGDDHPAVLDEVRRYLSQEFEVVGAVSNGQEAFEGVQQFDPDVLVTDISMPVLNGFQAAANLQACQSRAKIIFLSMHAGVEFHRAAFAVGASGFVSKSRLAVDLALAIREVYSGHTFISPQ
jgi:DNA-binding NarL/FixJ family response regulator